MPLCPLESCVLYEVPRSSLARTGCRRKTRCGLGRGVAPLLGTRPAVREWIDRLDFEDAREGPPSWVMDFAWGYFTPEEQRVLERWDRMYTAALGVRWKRDQAERDKPRSVR